MFELLRFVPKNLLSWFIGKLAHLRQPSFLVPVVIRWFVKRYQVDTSEIAQPLEEFPSLGEFFVRELKPGVRPIADGVVSPVDGVVSQHGEIEDGLLLQVKGRTYSLADLLQDESYANVFQGGYFITIYLAPPDYHRIHSPVDGKIIAAQHIPGKLWPVNSWSVNNIDNLFAVNERITTYIESEIGKVAVVKVGATNVGSISLSYDDIRSNSCPPVFSDCRKPLLREYENISVSKGDHIGTFHMGSTVILLFEHGRLNASESLDNSTKLKLGQKL